MALPTNVNCIRCRIKQRHSSSRFVAECGALSDIKNMSKNAFYFFALDWAKQQERRGISVPRNMKELSLLCSEDWKNLPPHEKEIYKTKARNSKIKAQGTVGMKTTIGENVAHLELEQKREEEFQQNMLQYIESTVSMGVQYNNLQNLKFIFIHVNWFYRRDIGINKYDFCPAEFAVAEFSLQNGIGNIYHELLKIKIPLGWKRDAIETSQETHQIPIELDDGESDFALMYDKFTKFLERNKIGNKYPPLFTMKNLCPVVESLLLKLSEAGGGPIDDYLIYSIEALFAELRNAAVRSVDNRSIPLVIAEIEFAKDFLCNTHGFECEFHKIIDVPQFCSKSIVTRWGMTICDYCCEYMNIEMIEGVHCPYKDRFQSNKQDIPNQNIDSIDFKIKSFKIGEKRTVVNMTGVSEDYRNRVSARSSKEEENRRIKSELEIIDHANPGTSKSNTAAQNLPMRPLRAPKTTAKALSGTEETIDLLNDVINFPPIGGRGTAIKKAAAGLKFSLGRGRAKC